MTSVIAIMETPFGVGRALGARAWWLVPGAAGVLAAYAYFPRPTELDKGIQNVAGAGASAGFNRACALMHVCTADRARAPSRPLTQTGSS